MNTKRIIVLGVALVAASAAAFLARGLMGGGTPAVEAKIAPPTPMSEVLVASSNIQPGLALKPEMVKGSEGPLLARVNFTPLLVPVAVSEKTGAAGGARSSVTVLETMVSLPAGSRKRE